MPRPRKKKETINEKILNSLGDGQIEKEEKLKDKLGFYKDESGFIINEQKFIVNCFSDMIVIGKLNKFNEIIYLNEKDIEWCKKNKIIYEKNL